jgi:hypothetical protein
MNIIRLHAAIIQETRNHLNKRGETEKPYDYENLNYNKMKNGVTPAQPTLLHVHNIIA